MLLPALLLAAIGGCNQYDVFLVSGYEQASFSNDADIVFVVDNSDSMRDEASDLALNFSSFIDYLTSAEGTPPTDGLSDAVDNYISFVSDRGSILDYQLAVTTTTAGDDGNPGSAGSLAGDRQVLRRGDDGLASAFTQEILCDTTCWRGATLPSDPSYQCGDPFDSISEEVLDCACGGPDWQTMDCGSGNEEGLEASFLSLCRAVANPPSECFDELSPLTDADIGSNAGMVRDGSTVIFVIVTDEGDSSRRIGNTDPDPTPYLQLLDKFHLRYRFAVIGPPYDPDAQRFPCNSGSGTTWGVERYITAADATEGFYDHIAEEDENGDCYAPAFSEHLQDLGDLLNSLLTAFPLQSIPDVSTIQSYVDGDRVPESDQGYDDFGKLTWSDGWSYDSGLNAVVFHGAAVPGYNAEVRIYYRPLEGNPRELPF